MANLESELQALQDQITALNGRIAFTSVEQIFDTRTAVADAVVAGAGTTVNTVVTGGYANPGDRGGGRYKWVALEPNHAGKVQSADGNWWELIPEGGRIRPQQLGAFDNGTDVSVELEAAIQYAIDEDVTLDLGTGTYLVGPAAATMNPTMPAGSSLHMIGHGAVVKELPGTTEIFGKWNQLLTLKAVGVTVADVRIEGITFDHSGSTVAPASGAGSNEFQQAHCLAFYALSGGVFERITIKDVITKEKVGGGIVFADGNINKAYLENCHGVDDVYTGFKRSDVEFQASIADLQLVGCSGAFVQSEPNASTPFGGITPRASFIGCNYTWWDLVGYTGDLNAQTYTLINCLNGPEGRFWVRNGFIYTHGGRLRVKGVNWRNVQGVLSGTTIVIPYDVGTHSFEPLDITTVSLVKIDVEFRGCSFVRDAAAFGTAPAGYAFDNSGTVLAADIDKYRVRFVEVDFELGFQGTADCYRNGLYEFIRCKLVSRFGFHAIQVGGDDARVSRVLIENCDLTRVNGDLVNVLNAGVSAWGFSFRGDMDYARFKIGGVAASGYQDTKVTHEAIWWAANHPTAGGLNGMIVRRRKPVHGTASAWICTTGSALSKATFHMTEQGGVLKGVAGSRPTPNADDIGLQYLDTTLSANGKPIWWNGSAWVDATGAVV